MKITKEKPIRSQFTCNRRKQNPLRDEYEPVIVDGEILHDYFGFYKNEYDHRRFNLIHIPTGTGLGFYSLTHKDIIRTIEKLYRIDIDWSIPSIEYYNNLDIGIRNEIKNICTEGSIL